MRLNFAYMSQLVYPLVVMYLMLIAYLFFSEIDALCLVKSLIQEYEVILVHRVKVNHSIRPCCNKKIPEYGSRNISGSFCKSHALSLGGAHLFPADCKELIAFADILPR